MPPDHEFTAPVVVLPAAPPRNHRNAATRTSGGSTSTRSPCVENRSRARDRSPNQKPRTSSRRFPPQDICPTGPVAGVSRRVWSTLTSGPRCASRTAYWYTTFTPPMGLGRKRAADRLRGRSPRDMESALRRCRCRGPARTRRQPEPDASVPILQTVRQREVDPSRLEKRVAPPHLAPAGNELWCSRCGKPVVTWPHLATVPKPTHPPIHRPHLADAANRARAGARIAGCSSSPASTKGPSRCAAAARAFLAAAKPPCGPRTTLTAGPGALQPADAGGRRFRGRPPGRS